MTFLRDKESVCRGGFSWTTLTQVLNVFPLVSIASIPVAYTVTTQPLSDFILPPSRRLLKDIFTATLWNQNQHTYKKPVLFNFFVTWIFSHFLSPFLLWKGASMLLLLQEHLTPGRGKKKTIFLALCTVILGQNGAVPYREQKLPFPGKLLSLTDSARNWTIIPDNYIYKKGLAHNLSKKIMLFTCVSYRDPHIVA